VPDVYYHLKPAAEAALKAKRTQIVTWRRIGIITSDRARELLADANQEFFRREFFEEVDASSMTGVRCLDCSKLHIMAREVRVYKCPCNPHLERNALLGRENLGVTA
jgi:hypothetical protein